MFEKCLDLKPFGLYQDTLSLISIFFIGKAK